MAAHLHNIVVFLGGGGDTHICPWSARFPIVNTFWPSVGFPSAHDPFLEHKGSFGRSSASGRASHLVETSRCESFSCETHLA